MTKPTIAVVGGSGLYDSGADVVERHDIDTPWGKPSGTIDRVSTEAIDILFIARHGQGHVLNPTEVPYRANVAALKHLGASAILSISACGSLAEECKPGHLVLCDQFIDRTRHRTDTFFDNGIVAHVSLADPFCEALSGLIASIIPTDITVHRGGTYLAMEGPQFSTRAESHWYRSLGARVIGMTNFTEARLAREAEMAYCSLALVTDYDCWREGDEVNVDDIMRVLAANADAGRRIVNALASVEGLPGSSAHNALQFAIITGEQHRSEVQRERLAFLRPSVEI